LASKNPVFPNNVIPLSRLDPIAQKLHPVFTGPTRPGLANNSSR
jgi:hypothetical protein